MDIANLQAFVAIADTGSFSVASEKLYLTQPAISKRLASLESELDTRLFDRIGRKVMLTEAGRALLPRAQHILLELEDSRRVISNLSQDVAGKLTIGTSHHIGLHRLPPVLRIFNTRYPQVDLDLQFMDSEQACKAIKQGQLELGIVTLPLVKDAELNTERIWADPLTVVVNELHPLANEAAVSTRQLCEHPAILPTTGTYTREIIEHAMQPHTHDIHVRMSTNYLETIKMMVSVGLGWSILPESMLSPELKAIKFKGKKLTRQLGAVWHARRTLSNAAHTMLDCLHQK